MNREDSNPEALLRACDAGRLDEHLTSRLLNAIEAASAPVDAVDASFESMLTARTPSAMPPGLLDRFSSLVEVAVPVDAEFEASLALIQPARLPASVLDGAVSLADSPVVPLPAPERVIPFRRFAAAAAIALVGAAAALVAPIGGISSPAPVADNAPTSGTAAPRLSPADARSFVPAGHQRGLSDASDEGVVWKNDQPHRVLRIVYQDTITLTNEAGEIVELEQPRVEYILVPEKMD